MDVTVVKVEEELDQKQIPLPDVQIKEEQSVKQEDEPLPQLTPVCVKSEESSLWDVQIHRSPEDISYTQPIEEDPEDPEEPSVRQEEEQPPQAVEAALPGRIMEEKLIIAVCNRPELYDTRSYYYRDRKRGRLAWREVSEEIGAPVDVCKNKWKGLRDTYAKKKKDEEKRKKESAENPDHRPQWRFFAVLSFLDRFVITRSNTSGQESDEEQEMDDGQIHCSPEPGRKREIPHTSPPEDEPSVQEEEPPQTEAFFLPGIYLEDKLIIAVCNRPELYDSRSCHYRDRKRVRVAWREISKELGVPVEMCKTKWKGLRDTYAKKKREEEKRKKESGSKAEQRPPWRFFAVLSFLDRFLMPRSSRTRHGDPAEDLHSNTSGPESDEEPEMEAESAEAQEPRAPPSPVASSGSQSPFPGPSPSAAAPSASAPAPSAQRRRAVRRPREPSSSVEEALLEYLRQPPPPPPRDYTALEHYLLSLAPSLERLPFLDQELVKTKMNQIILNHLQNLSPD